MESASERMTKLSFIVEPGAYGGGACPWNSSEEDRYTPLLVHGNSVVFENKEAYIVRGEGISGMLPAEPTCLRAGWGCSVILLADL